MEKVSIMCKNCGKFLCNSDKDNRIHKLLCKNCGKWIWFNPETNEFKVLRKPERATSGGVRFY